ncbi:MAG: hypothetical protein D6739_10680 [Nitrospirae bacterium]|nr:MAG: hypothetical protein D6739_10680 [Nitrospirota bacterium]
MDAIPKEELFRRIGYGGDPEAAEQVLEWAGLSRPAKRAIHPDKEEAVREALEAAFFWVCNRGDCRAEAERRAAGRTVVPAAEPAACQVCGGSVNQRRVDEMVAACTARGWRRLVVVGGSPNARDELRANVAGRLELRLLDGTTARTAKQARGDLAWADVVVVWGSTQLDHKVSNLYRGPKVIALHRRSIQELATEVARAAGA